MRTVFLGGPGRSGTSYVAARLGAHPEVITFPGIELKLVTEKNGLLDLHHCLVETYSPNRASVALREFCGVFAALVEGRYGQRGLAEAAPGVAWQPVLDAFTAEITRDGHPCRMTDGAFHAAARRFFNALIGLCPAEGSADARPKLFLEKTPHTLLGVGFLERLTPGARFVHVMRDPRSIAQSLQRMPWAPDRLETCCAWVESYCEAYAALQARAARTGTEILELAIEAAVGNNTRLADWLCRELGLSEMPDLFAYSDLATLNGWAATVEPEVLALLNRRLGGWVRHFGYTPEVVGRPAGYAEAA